jgi:hypothetical protein
MDVARSTNELERDRRDLERVDHARNGQERESFGLERTTLGRFASLTPCGGPATAAGRSAHPGLPAGRQSSHCGRSSPASAARVKPESSRRVARQGGARGGNRSGRGGRRPGQAASRANGRRQPAGRGRNLDSGRAPWRWQRRSTRASPTRRPETVKSVTPSGSNGRSRCPASAVSPRARASRAARTRASYA